MLDFSASNAYAAAGECNVLCMCYIQWKAPRKEGDFNVSLEEEEKLFHFFFFFFSWRIFFILLFYRVIYNIFHAHSHTRSVQLFHTTADQPTYSYCIISYCAEHIHMRMRTFLASLFFGCCCSCTIEYFIIYSHLFQRKRNHLFLQWEVFNLNKRRGHMWCYKEFYEKN